MSVREADLVSQTDYDRKVEANLEGMSQGSKGIIPRGTFYQTQMTQMASGGQGAFDMSSNTRKILDGSHGGGPLATDPND